MSSLVLDTHVWFWLATGSPSLGRTAGKRIEIASTQGAVLLPVICIWELAMLEADHRIYLPESIDNWIAAAISDLRIQLVELSSAILLESVRLPGDFHRDPADRMIVAAARILQVPVVTRDKRIIAYGQAGHVRVVTA